MYVRDACIEATWKIARWQDNENRRVEVKMYIKLYMSIRENEIIYVRCSWLVLCEDMNQ